MKFQNKPSHGRGLLHPENSQVDILVLHNREPRIDSRVISERAGIHPNGEEHHEEACKVGAVMALLNGSIRELTDARDCFQEHRTHTTGE
ncbi:TPA: hypothetical protein MPK85_003999 [Salmonella enterica]|nr:hypothetical protein [Salmonella enterica]